MLAFLHTCAIRPDGSKDSFLTQQVECRLAEMPWHKKNLTWTASGYGARIPSRYMIKVNGRWRRVYTRIYSNVGTCFIGAKYDGSNTVQIEGV